MFKKRKVAQMVAFFLGQTPDSKMKHQKLMKLMYLSDREALRVLGWPMSGDRFVCLPHGPVLSQTLNLMDGDVESKADGWEAWISDKENHELALRQPLDMTTLDDLAPAEIDVLNDVWKTFGSMNQWAIRDWTHQHCAEWQDPDGSSMPIEFDAVARAVGFNEDAAKILAAQILADQEVDHLFATL